MHFAVMRMGRGEGVEGAGPGCWCGVGGGEVEEGGEGCGEEGS